MSLYSPLPCLTHSVVEYQNYCVVYSCNVQFKESKQDFTDEITPPYTHITKIGEPIVLLGVKSSTHDELSWSGRKLQYPGVQNSGLENPYYEFAIAVGRVNTFVRLYDNTNGLCKIYLQKRDNDTHRVGKLLFALHDILQQTKTLKIKKEVVNQQLQYFSKPVHAPMLRIVFMIYNMPIMLKELDFNDRQYIIQNFFHSYLEINFKRDTERVSNVKFTLLPTSENTLQEIMQEYLKSEDYIKHLVKQEMTFANRNAVLSNLMQRPEIILYQERTDVSVFVKYEHCVISVGLNKVTIYAQEQHLHEIRQLVSGESSPAASQQQYLGGIKMLLL